MIRVSGSENLNVEASVVALGNFDGLHIGHKKLIDETVFYAKKHSVKSIIWSFAKHPENIIAGESTVKSITTIDEKGDILDSYGIDIFCIEDFSAVRDLSPDEFIIDILIGKLHAKHVVVGFNFRFGKHAVGDSDYLKVELEKRGISVHIVPPVIFGETIVSSSYIRYLISKGDMSTAAMMLGRPFFIDFAVVHGNKLGRKIGVPTINQWFPEDHIVPKRGVYATTCMITDKPYLGVCNVGIRPTVGNGEKVTCETHILDYVGDLYGERIKVSFYKRIRDEIRFPSLEELTRQIESDKAETKSYFNLNF